ncbi:Release factor glutamine methyltransferase [uncultured Alphaproteobacteria bacterium]|uniref:Release factor glutamine methyltransferase n=1 Tax=uncultured Alphaproteobacteria bacterium TaxID=91750 RepID=A0A212IXR0_9PROT|nr:Release factor glutamine methyltransferase [uncultured Alphaproteobacteria bacterium]
MTLGEVVAWATEALRAAGVEGPRRDARVLVGAVLGVDMAAMLAHPEHPVDEAERARVEAAVRRRAAREPVSRILGVREFWGLEFRLGEETLDPRPDSETVVAALLEGLGDAPRPRVLDLGTGTGCLLLAVLAERPGATGVGVDAAPGAVAVAAENAAALGLTPRAEFVVRDWRNPGWREGLGRFDAVIANPPYIPDADVPGLEPEVRVYDPHAALAGGADGLDPYRLLCPQVPELLVPGGVAAFEVGIGQADAVSALFGAAGLRPGGVRADLGGVDRAVVAFAPAP